MRLVAKSMIDLLRACKKGTLEEATKQAEVAIQNIAQVRESVPHCKLR